MRGKQAATAPTGRRAKGVGDEAAGRSRKTMERKKSEGDERGMED